MNSKEELKKVFRDHENFVYYGLRKAEIQRAVPLIEEYHTLCRKSAKYKNLYNDQYADLSIRVLSLIDELTEEKINKVILLIYDFNTLTPQ